MKEVLAAIERHLGRSVHVSQLDYYQVFGLELYCDDPREIRDALQQATNRWLQSDTVKYPESAQIVAKLLRQAQGILLNDEKREKYNHQLRELHASRTEPSQTRSRGSVSDQDPTEPSDEIDVLFPDADPMAPWAFDTSTSFDKRTDSRCALLEQIQDPKMRLAELEQLFPSLVELDSAPRLERIDAETPLALPPLKRSRAPTGSGSSLAEQILRKRKRKRILYSVASMFVSVAALATSIGLYLNHRKQSELKGKQSQRLTMREDNVQNGATQNLPKVERKESINGNQDPSLQTPSLPSVSKPETDSETKSEPKMDEAPVNTAPPSNLPPMDAPPAVASSEPVAETAEWKKRMASTRAAIERADFESFEEGIKQCLPARTPRGRDQAARLDQLGQLYQMGFESFEEAKKKLTGTVALKIGSKQISIVENTPEKLVVKDGGQPTTYLWKKLPFGYAKAMMNLELDTEEPNTVAARAVFFSLAPDFREEAKTQGIMKKDIEGWFKKSAGQAGIRADLPQALTDTYE